jgi:hypothetical protein
MQLERESYNGQVLSKTCQRRSLQSHQHALVLNNTLLYPIFGNFTNKKAWDHNEIIIWWPEIRHHTSTDISIVFILILCDNRSYSYEGINFPSNGYGDSNFEGFNILDLRDVGTTRGYPTYTFLPFLHIPVQYFRVYYADCKGFVQNLSISPKLIKTTQNYQFRLFKLNMKIQFIDSNFSLSNCKHSN